MRRSADPTPVARPVLTGRALVLGAVVVLLIVVLAAPVTRYLGSRSDVTHAAQQLQADRVERARLQHQKASYGDPGYVEQQARRRLSFAMPGDTVYTVTRPGQRTAIENTTGVLAGRRVNGSAWNDRLWNSVRAAGR